MKVSKHKCSHNHQDFETVRPNQIIGVFDSGVGGFSVYKEIKQATDMSIVYVGDCAYAPYGNKHEDAIRERIKKILLFLKMYGVTYYVSACNSMSVLTTEKLLEEVGIPKEKYCDMVDLVSVTNFQEKSKVLIVGTVATIASHVYQDLLKKKGLAYEVYSPKDLAQGVEEKAEEVVYKEVYNIVLYAQEHGCDSLLYACTHYPLVADVFEDVAYKLKYQGDFINPAVSVVLKVPHLHDDHSHEDVFITTKDTPVFRTYTGNASILVVDL